MTGAILTGGFSKRMGMDKAFINYDNELMIERAIRLCRTITDDFYISCRQDQTQQLSKFGSIIIDEIEDLGPLGGINSVLKTLQSDTLFLVVDMPRVTAHLLSRLIESHKEQHIASVFQTNGNQVQPFPGIYTSDAIEPINAQIRNGQLSCRQFLQHQNVNLLSAEDTSAFENWNRPQDLPKRNSF